MELTEFKMKVKVGVGSLGVYVMLEIRHPNVPVREFSSLYLQKNGSWFFKTQDDKGRNNGWFNSKQQLLDSFKRGADLHRDDESRAMLYSIENQLRSIKDEWWGGMNEWKGSPATNV